MSCCSHHISFCFILFARTVSSRLNNVPLSDVHCFNYITRRLAARGAYSTQNVLKYAEPTARTAICTPYGCCRYILAHTTAVCSHRRCCCCTPADAPSRWNKLPTVADLHTSRPVCRIIAGDRDSSVSVRISALCTNLRRSAAAG